MQIDHCFAKPNLLSKLFLCCLTFKKTAMEGGKGEDKVKNTLIVLGITTINCKDYHA